MVPHLRQIKIELFKLDENPALKEKAQMFKTSIHWLVVTMENSNTIILQCSNNEKGMLRIQNMTPRFSQIIIMAKGSHKT